MAKPLDGIRVFDITLVGVGPWAGKLLAYLGADVIHVEAPGRVGELGGTEAALNSAGIIYANANNNKRSVMLDLKEHEGPRCGLPAAANVRRLPPEHAAGRDGTPRPRLRDHLGD